MRASFSHWIRLSVVVVAVLCAVVLASGCGYVKNVRDDFYDCIILRVGVTPPVARVGGESIAGGIVPWSIGVYVQATDFLQLGVLTKASVDIAWERRGHGIVVDQTTKFGLGPFHKISIEQTPIYATDYLKKDGAMNGWRQHMLELKDPLFDNPAKVLVYDEALISTATFDVETGEEQGESRLPYLHRGWQHWQFFTAEIAIPEPIITKLGFNFAVGFDPSEVFDLITGIFCLDLYDDAAFRIISGEPRF